MGIYWGNVSKGQKRTKDENVLILDDWQGRWVEVGKSLLIHSV